MLAVKNFLVSDIGFKATDKKSVIASLQSFPILLFFTLFATISLAQISIPVDKKATRETVSLYNNLRKISKTGFLFGH